MTQTNSHNASRPEWLKVRVCGSPEYLEVQSLLKQHDLHTVCQEANCPNRAECFSKGTATFLIMGPNCTRNCRFCNVAHGATAEPDAAEPAHIARTVALLGIKHAVITSVTRDDLPDGGAGHFVRVVKAIRGLERGVTVEVLTPDFQGDPEALRKVLAVAPEVFNHNVETVPRLYPKVRPAANYRRSLKILGMAADHGDLLVKSGIMVGLGESAEELRLVFRDLKVSGVTLLTVGQYLPPSARHYPVARYYHPDEFNLLARQAREAGIPRVLAGPLVRSSYHAEEQYHPA
ncbi:MAG: lipoyl synthase [Candidatus Zixiibacteriota bacterium]|nr:MAG: lipoyl synthase [candidate division Zixibacteria bacterium]